MEPNIKWRGICKLVEELGELQQVLGKIMAYPNLDHPVDNLKVNLMDELGDVQAAINYFSLNNLTLEEAIKVVKRSEEKLDKFKIWRMSGINL